MVLDLNSSPAKSPEIEDVLMRLAGWRLEVDPMWITDRRGSRAECGPSWRAECSADETTVTLRRQPKFDRAI